MAQYKTKKKEKYYDKVCHMYFDQQMTITQIGAIIPVNPSTVFDWICIFAAENGKTVTRMQKTAQEAFAVEYIQQV